MRESPEMKRHTRHAKIPRNKSFQKVTVANEDDEREKTLSLHISSSQLFPSSYEGPSQPNSVGGQSSTRKRSTSFFSKKEIQMRKKAEGEKREREKERIPFRIYLPISRMWPVTLSMLMEDRLFLQKQVLFSFCHSFLFFLLYILIFLFRILVLMRLWVDL